MCILVQCDKALLNIFMLQQYNVYDRSKAKMASINKGLSLFVVGKC